MKKYIILFFALVTTMVWAQDCPDQVKITAPAGSGGQVTRTPVGDCKTTYTLVAQPFSGYEFVGWADDASITSATREVTIPTTSDTQYRAIFGKTSDLHPTGGTIAVGVSDISTLTYSMTAIPTVSCDTINWNNGSHNATVLYTEGDGTRTVSFKAEDKLAYQVVDASPVGGTILATVEDCGFTLKAQPAAGYGFVKWQDTNSPDSVRHVDNIAHMSYTAIFGYGTAIKDGVVYATTQEAIDESQNLPITLIKNADENLLISKAVTIDGNNHSVGNLTITNTGDLTLSGSLTASNLILNATQGASSQLRNANNLTYDNAYVDIRLEPVKDEANTGDKYYAIGVPFQVEVPAAKSASTAITRLSALSTATTNQSDYVLWAYDGELRAESKKSGWTLVEDDVLQPGQFYMFGVNQNDNIWRFKKKAGSALGGSTSLAVAEYPSDCPNKGWNGLSNSQLVYAQATIDGIDYAQTYDNASASGKYEVAPFEDVAYVMGGTFFIQAEANGTLTLSAKGEQPYLRAPMRASDNKVRCRVELSNATQHDVLYLTARDEATTTYQVGKDVIKMLGGGADSYIWANDYGYTLCANDKPWVDSVAEFSVTMYASQAGEYTLTAPMGELLYNGAYRANLALGNYTLHLQKGYNKGYSIRLGEKMLFTGMVNVNENAKVNKNAKVMIDGQLIIIHESKMFNAQGTPVR